jgi:hypothetical protein
MTSFYKLSKEEQKIHLDKLQANIDLAWSCFDKIMSILPIFRKCPIEGDFHVNFKVEHKTFEFYVCAWEHELGCKKPKEVIYFHSDYFRNDVDGLKKALSDLENFCEKYNLKIGNSKDAINKIEVA